MATGQYIGVNGVARKVVSPYIGVEGVARNVKNGYVGVDGVARLFFAPESGGPVILEVEKIVSNTYANETTYTAEEFILLDIYPKTGGTVNVTYGGLTKTITDTSGAEKPNAQQVFFGTFNGVTDSVATPSRGTLTIEGDYNAFAVGSFSLSKLDNSATCPCITAVTDFGSVKTITTNMFEGCTSLKSITIPYGVGVINAGAFDGCTGIEHIHIPSSVYDIPNLGLLAPQAFAALSINNPITIDEWNDDFYIDGNCLIRKADNFVVAGFADSIIPDGVIGIENTAFFKITDIELSELPNGIKTIGLGAFYSCSGITIGELPNVETIGNYSFCQCTGLTSLAIGNSLKTIKNHAFYKCTGLTSLTIGNSVTSIEEQAFGGCTGLTSITIPDSVTSISGDAFSKCTGLTSVVFENTSGWYATQTENGDASTGTHLYMEDTSVNVDILVNDFSGWYIYRS